MKPLNTCLVIGTKNPAKFDRYHQILSRYQHLEILSPQDLRLNLAIIENGASPQENARIKARTYAQRTGLPALGIDEALYIPALPPDEQPGMFVRRHAGGAFTDEGLLRFYQEKALQLTPEDRLAEWLYAACLAFPDGIEYESESKYPCRLVTVPRLPYPSGYPLSALMVDVETGKAFSEMSPSEQRTRERSIDDMVVRLLCDARLDSPADRR